MTRGLVMARMLSNIVNRVKGLPEPSNAHEALYPLFEAVSNAVYAIQDLNAEKPGKISIIIRNFQELEKLEIEVKDDGIGFDEEHFKAFSTTDSSWRLGSPGKGVGRLLWLAAFESIVVDSAFRQDGQIMERCFSLQRKPGNEIEGGDNPSKIKDVGRPQGTSVQFKGLREGAYQKYFPRTRDKIFKHLSSHFLADILLKRFPKIHVSVDQKTAQFPKYLTDMRIEQRKDVEFQIKLDEEGKKADKFRLSSFVLKREASVGFPSASNLLHLTADGRKVLSRPLDKLLGFKAFGKGHVYHGCVEGGFLNQRVNQQRTYFNFEEKTAEKITKECVEQLRSNTLHQECEKHDKSRSLNLDEFLRENPSYRMGAKQGLFKNLPRSATKHEEFAKALVPNLIRRQAEHRKRIDEAVKRLDSDEKISKDFGKKVREAAENIREEERLQLAEYVLRRKMLLDVMEKLIGRTKPTSSGEKQYHLEETLHRFICPMRVHGGTEVEASAHDLWILDERLTFTTYFASDVTFKEIVEKSKDKKRADLLVFDQINALNLQGQDPLTRVLLVEFKRPGRDDYAEDYDPTAQVRKYVKRLAGGKVIGYTDNRVEVSRDCAYHCFIVADITPTLAAATEDGWQRTSNGRGLRQQLLGERRVISIEIIPWKVLLQDARLRLEAFDEALGV